MKNDNEQTLRDTQHKLANVQQEKRALTGLLTRAADELDKLAEADCDTDAIARAERTADKLRKAAETTSGKN